MPFSVPKLPTLSATADEYGAVSVIGQGFASTGPLELLLLDSSGAEASGPFTVETGQDGSLETMIEAPWEAGTYTVRVSGDFAGYPTQTVETTFTVYRREVFFEGPRIQDGVFNLIFTGSGFAPGERVSFRVMGADETWTIEAGPDGGFTANVPAPQEPGDYEVQVEYPDWNDTIWVTVPVMPTVQADGYPWGQYSVVGTGFDPFTTLQLYLEGVFWQEVSVDQQGCFEVVGIDGPQEMGVHAGQVLGDFAGATNQSLAFELVVALIGA
ncbi:hypothetical protein GCM10028820_12480 [Tessaracoccus terricola]